MTAGSFIFFAIVMGNFDCFVFFLATLFWWYRLISILMVNSRFNVQQLPETPLNKLTLFFINFFSLRNSFSSSVCFSRLSFFGARSFFTSTTSSSSFRFCKNFIVFRLVFLSVPSIWCLAFFPRRLMKMKIKVVVMKCHSLQVIHHVYNTKYQKTWEIELQVK